MSCVSLMALPFVSFFGRILDEQNGHHNILPPLEHIASGFVGVVLIQIRPSADRITCGVNGISVIIAPNALSASFTAFATAAAAPAVPASPAPLAPSSVSEVGDTTWPTSMSGISPDTGTR